MMQQQTASKPVIPSYVYVSNGAGISFLPLFYYTPAQQMGVMIVAGLPGVPAQWNPRHTEGDFMKHSHWAVVHVPQPLQQGLEGVPLEMLPPRKTCQGEFLFEPLLGTAAQWHISCRLCLKGIKELIQGNPNSPFCLYKLWAYRKKMLGWDHSKKREFIKVSQLLSLLYQLGIQ